MEILLLRFDAPLMSFGGVMVDHNGPTDRFPGLSLLTGLFGNALGYCHRDADLIEALQYRIEYAARWDIEPEPLLDYHTVDFKQPKMFGYADINKKSDHGGWTTRGVPEHRSGGDDTKYGTHIRYRHYWANGVMSLAVSLINGDPPDINQLYEALRRPARPLFIGRKTCLPASPLPIGKIDALDLIAALRSTDKVIRSNPIKYGRMSEACWPTGHSGGHMEREVWVYDRRDWRNQIHTGRRLRIEGMIQEEEYELLPDTTPI
jgi:CRISPR system Cascade subunit CasD